MKIVSIINQKGGVGKSTIAVNLAYGLSQANKNTLLIDLDPQAHSSCIYTNNVSKNKSISEVFSDQNCDLNSLIFPAKIEDKELDKLHIIPSSIHLALTVEQISGRIYRERILNNHLKKLSSKYDVIILDCPPTLGLLAINAIYASDIILIPTNYGKYSLDGIADLLQSIKEIKEEQSYKFLIVRNLYERRNSQTNRFINEQLEQVKEYLMDTIIRKNEAINQSQINGTPVKYFNRTCNGAHDFAQLTMEFLANVA